MSNLTFAPGETNISQARFTPSLLLFWLKTDMAVTNRRFVAKEPNTILGLIPLGYRDLAYPLHNVASAGVSVKFSLWRVVLGALILIGGLGGFKQSAVLGIVFVLIGLSLLANAATATIILTNNGGGKIDLRVSVLEKDKLEQFRNEVNSRLFTDYEGLRHNEAMGAAQLSVLLQQQQLQAMQNLSQGQSVPPPPGPRPVQGQSWPQGHPSQPPLGQPAPPLQGQPWQQGQTWQAPPE